MKLLYPSYREFIYESGDTLIQAVVRAWDQMKWHGNLNTHKCKEVYRGFVSIFDDGYYQHRFTFLDL